MTPTPFDIDKVRIDDILITNASIENRDNLSELEKGHHQFDLTYGFDPALNVEQKKARFVFNCEIRVFDNNRNWLGVSGKFAIAFFFSVENLDGLVSNRGENTEIDTDLMISLANITYSTSRGIIFTRCQGTIIKKIIFPVISNARIREMFMQIVNEPPQHDT